MRTTKYYDEDVNLLLQDFSYTPMSDDGIKRYLSRTLSLLNTDGYLLAHYPLREYHCLRFIYSSRKALDAFNLDLLHDLLFSGSWRHATLGTWLACLSPSPAFESLLLESQSIFNSLQSLHTVALAHYGHAIPDSLIPLQEHIDVLRNVVLSLYSTVRPLRVSLQESLLPEYKASLDEIRSIYKRLGADAVLPLTKQGLVYYYGQSYQEWRKNGAQPLP